MNFKSKLSRVAIAVAVSAGLAGTAIAQETSSGIRGTIVTESGAIVDGATITITDQRTGQTRTYESESNGAFSARGLRVGGPYTINVTDSSGSRTVEDVYLSLGESSSIDISLQPTDVERIVVSGYAGGVITETNGPSANFGFEDLQTQPNVDRDIKDVIATDPRISIDPTNANAIGCAGVNNRFNSLTVDGVKQNDNFGLNANGYPTERLPFPFDAIDQVAVELAPFNVQYGGFTGCNINAVTRSGTNEVHGSVFFDYTNDSLQGDSVDGDDFVVPAFNERRYGATIGFPIIKDKLFFFGAFEKHEPVEIIEFGPEGAPVLNEIEGLTQDVVDRVAGIANDVYGYQVGDVLSSLDLKEEKILAKLDWEINNDHRAQITYQNTEGFTLSTSGLGNDSFAFSDRFYQRANELTTYGVQIFSDWSSKLSTQFRVNRAEVVNGQTPQTTQPDFGSVTIFDVVPNVDFNIGADQFRQANQLNYDTDNYVFIANYFEGDHEIMAGVEYESVSVFNLFVPGSQGIFEFDSLEDFENQQASRIEYNIPPSLDVNDGAAEFEFNTFTAYMQDRWMVNADLTLTFGLRYDRWDSDSDPVANSRFEQRYGFSNAQGPDFDLVQPRLGFNYIVDDETFIYGGAGLFAGGNPNVWLSNNYSNNGVSIRGSEFEGDATDPRVLAALDGTNTANFGFEVPALSTDEEFFVGGDGAVNAMAPGFEVPALWKYNIGIQKEVQYGVILAADIIYTREDNPAMSVPLNVRNIGTAPDGRPVYRDFDALDADCQADPLSSDCGRSGTDYLLTNNPDEGDGWVYTFTAQKTFDNGFDVNFGYSHQDIEQGSPMNSSTASSNFGNLSVRDLGQPAVATSNYQVEHRFTLNLSYAHEFIDGYPTRVNLFATRRSGQVFSYTFDGDPGFGDERFFEDRNLLYVPLENDPIVNYAPEFDQAAFNDFIADAGLNGSRGTIVDRNAQDSDWVSRVDLRISQDIPGFMEGHTGEIFFVVRNLGNLLNDEWGTLRQVPFEYNEPVVDASFADGVYTFENFDGPRGQRVDTPASTWSARVGINYRF